MVYWQVQREPDSNANIKLIMHRIATLIICLILALTLTSNAGADMYECKDEFGRINYTDQPCEDGKLIKKTPVNTMPAEQIQPQDTEQPAERYEYKSLTITSPEDGSYHRINRPLPVKLRLTPPLQGGHRVRLVINGKPYKGRVSSSGASIMLENVGDASIKAQVVDRKMKLLIESAPVVVHGQPRHLPYAKTPDIESEDPGTPDTPTAMPKPQQAVPFPQAPRATRLPKAPIPPGNTN
jgi:hypothetical protein